MSFLTSALAASMIAGCSDDDPAGQPQTDPRPDGGQPPTTDGGSGKDAAPDSDIPNAQPKVVSLSTNGHDRLYGVTFDSTGNIYAVGRHTETTSADEDFQSIVVKFKGDGTLDTTFGEDGIAKVNLVEGRGTEFARGIVIQSTGKIVIAGVGEKEGDLADTDVYLARFNADGTLDKAGDFGNEGIVTFDFGGMATPTGARVRRDDHWGLTLAENDGLIVTGASLRPVAGSEDTDFTVAKLLANGTKDPAFQPTGASDGVFRLDPAPAVGDSHPSASPRNATVLADGSIVVAGYQAENDVVVPVVFKLKSDGKLDPSFGSGGVFKEIVLTAISEVYGAALQGANFVTAGYGNDKGETTRDWLSIRILANGTRDMTYGTGGHTRIDLAGQSDNARAVVVLPDERIALVGGARPVDGNSNATIGLLSKDGQPDLTFGPKGLRTYDLGGPGDFFWATAVSPDKKKLVTVGLYGADADGGDDDAALLILPLP